MSVIEDLADKLAADAIEAAEAMDDDKLIMDIANLMGSSSQITEEAFLSAVRGRMAAKRGREMLNQRIAAFEAKLKNQQS